MQGKGTNQGFTLVEIAIVLVIIGLLLGGILKGQEMITQAKIKNVIADFSGVSAAYHGYQDRYRAIPGDDPNAATRWAVAPAAISGNGNGQVAGTYNNQCPQVVAAGTVESCLFWDDLRRAGFVSGTGGQQPFNALTGLIGVQTGDGVAAGVGPTLLNAAGGNGFVGLLMCSANLPDKIAIAVDTQMDDGASNLGTVRALLQQAPNPNVGAGQVATAAFAETGTNIYVLCRAL
jgi:prepilin-type N-terminal cleavage/methylation domain-containing protein